MGRAIEASSAPQSPRTTPSTAPNADADALDRISARDQRALGELYDRHCGHVYGMALRILAEQHAAEQIVVEVFVAVWTAAGVSSPASASPAAWLLRLTRDRAVQRLRQMPPHSPAAPPHLLSAAVDPPILTDMGSSVTAALKRLPSLQQEMIEAAFFGGLTVTELAERFETAPSTVRATLTAGLHALRDGLSKST